MNEWMNEWMSEWMNEWEQWISESMNHWIRRLINGMRLKKKLPTKKKRSVRHNEKYAENSNYHNAFSL